MKTKSERKRIQKLVDTLFALTCGLIGFTASGAAQDYPTKPVTIVVPYPPGGGVDVMARVVAEKLSVALKCK